MLFTIILCLVVFGALITYKALKSRNMQNWIVDYLIRLFKRPKVDGPIHVMFCFVDHYEPQWQNRNNLERERARVDRWCKDYRSMASKHKDADGCMPKHSFFYPEEEYREEHLDKLAQMCHEGYGEIEIHLHHDDDTSENLTKTLTSFAQTLHERHGALSKHPVTGQVMYAFIHGNWALDNSRRDGCWCGVNDELQVLRRTGCYADFTYPSAPSETQTAMTNSIYYATDDPDRPKSHNRGVEVSVGGAPVGDLMIIQGPLGISLKWRSARGIPHIENSDIRASSPPLKVRVDQWVSNHIHVKGRPEWIYIKIHTHGANETDMDTLLGQPMDDMHTYLEDKYNDGDNYVLHYVSAREMYNIIKAAEAGKSGNPNEYRDWLLPAPSNLPQA